MGKVFPAKGFALDQNHLLIQVVIRRTVCGIELALYERDARKGVVENWQCVEGVRARAEIAEANRSSAAVEPKTGIGWGRDEEAG
jgi:hypothetical protein